MRKELDLSIAAMATVILGLVAVIFAMLGGWLDGVLYEQGLISTLYVREFVAAVAHYNDILIAGFEHLLLGMGISVGDAQQFAPLFYVICAFGFVTFDMYGALWLLSGSKAQRSYVH